MVIPRAWAVLRLMTSSNPIGLLHGQVRGFGSFEERRDRIVEHMHVSCTAQALRCLAVCGAQSAHVNAAMCRV
jgi:hypothetical protein